MIFTVLRYSSESYYISNIINTKIYWNPQNIWISAFNKRKIYAIYSLVSSIAKIGWVRDTDLEKRLVASRSKKKSFLDSYIECEQWEMKSSAPFKAKLHCQKRCTVNSARDADLSPLQCWSILKTLTSIDHVWPYTTVFTTAYFIFLQIWPVIVLKFISSTLRISGFPPFIVTHADGPSHFVQHYLQLTRISSFSCWYHVVLVVLS